MDSYLYFCTGCNKLFKVADTGRKVKCSNCSEPLVDLEITDTEYAALNPEKREALKDKARGLNNEPEKKEEKEAPAIFDINALIYGSQDSGADAGMSSGAEADRAPDDEPGVSQNTEPYVGPGVSQSTEPDIESSVSQNTEPDVEPGASQNMQPDLKSGAVPDPEPGSAPAIGQNTEPDREPGTGQNTEQDNGTEQLPVFKPDMETETGSDEDRAAEPDNGLGIDLSSELGIDIGDSFKDPYAAESSVLSSLAETKAKIDNELEKQADEVISVRNNYLKIQIQNQLLTVDNFLSICKLSALQDDGVVDKDEEKLLKKLEKASAEYKKALNKLI